MASSSARSRKKRKPLLNWPKWYEPSISSSLVESEASTIIGVDPEDTAFADILDRIIQFTDWATLSRLRLVSHQFRRHVDAFQLRHLVLRSVRRPRDPSAAAAAWYSYSGQAGSSSSSSGGSSHHHHAHHHPHHPPVDIIIRGLNGRLIPAIKRVRLTSWAGSVRMHQAEARLFEMMNKHTRVVDLVGGFDEYVLGRLSFGSLEYLRVIPDDGQYVSSFPFAPSTLVLFNSDLPLTPPRVHGGHIGRRTTKVVIVHDGDSTFEPNRYWPGLTRGPPTRTNSTHDYNGHRVHSVRNVQFIRHHTSATNGGSSVAQLVVVFQPEVKSTARGRLGFGANFWVNAFALDQFDDEWLTVRRPAVTSRLGVVTAMAAEQPRWAITLVGLHFGGGTGAQAPAPVAPGRKALGTATHLFALGGQAGRRDNRPLRGNMVLCTMTQYTRMLGNDLHLLLETMQAF